MWSAEATRWVVSRLGDLETSPSQAALRIEPPSRWTGVRRPRRATGPCGLLRRVRYEERSLSPLHAPRLPGCLERRDKDENATATAQLHREGELLRDPADAVGALPPLARKIGLLDLGQERWACPRDPQADAANLRQLEPNEEEGALRERPF
jgi:hypothetical protein